MTIEGDLFADYLDKLGKLADGKTIKEGVTNALVKSKEYVTPLIENAVQRSNLPAQGKYSKGGTLKSLNRDTTVTTDNGYEYATKVGFDLKKSGLKSIFLMYGTPRMSPAKGLKDAIYGDKSQKQIRAIQSEELNKAVKKVMEG